MTHYFRLSIRFKNISLLPRLRALQRAVSAQSNKKVSLSQLVEKIVEQYLDTNRPQIEERS